MIEGVTTVLCDADGNLFPSEEPAFVASAEVTNAFLAALGVASRFTADQLRLATTGKSFRTTAVDLAVAHGVAVAGTSSAPDTGEGPVLGVELLEHWVEEERLPSLRAGGRQLQREHAPGCVLHRDRAGRADPR
jgi:hypothetical protein